MEKLRVQSGIVIEVNDAGETITLRVDDMGLIDKFYVMVDRFENIGKELDEIEDQDEVIRVSTEKSREIMTEIDKLFGDETCRKVFGAGIVPTPYVYMDFFEQLMPIFNKYSNDRQKMIANKYSKKRTGGK